MALKWTLRVLGAILGLLVCSVTAQAQSITISGNVYDTNGTVYAGGSGVATLVPGNVAFTINQINPVRTPVPIAQLDSFGHFSLTLTNTSVIDQQSSNPEWQISFCSAQYANPTTKYCFTMTPLALTSSQDITATITPQAAILPTMGVAGGCVVAGVTGDLQEKNGTHCAAAPIHDTGSALDFTEPVNPLAAENIAQKPNPATLYVDAIEGQAGTDCQTEGSAACLYLETAWEDLWAYNLSNLDLQGGTIFLNAPAQQHINLNASSTTPNGGYVMRIIGTGDPNYAADCSSATLPTCTIGGLLWYKMPPTGVALRCVNGSYLGAEILSTFGFPCLLNMSIITSGVGSKFSADGIALLASSSYPGYMAGYSSNQIYGDTAITAGDAPIITNSVFTGGNGPGPWMPAVAYASLIEAQFLHDYFGATSAGQSLNQLCNIITATRSGNVATFDCSAAHNFPSAFFGAPLYLAVTDVADTTFNKMGTVTVVDSTHLSMVNDGPAATSSGGYIYGPASYAVYGPGSPGSSAIMGLNQFVNDAMDSGGMIVTAGAGGSPGAPTAQVDHLRTEGLVAGMASITTNALDYSGGIDDLGGNADNDPLCVSTNVECGGGIRIYGVNGGLVPGVAQATNDINANGANGCAPHSHCQQYSVAALPDQTAEMRDAVGFVNGDVRAAWPGGNRSGAPLYVQYANQCPTTPTSWTGTTVTAVPSYLDAPASGTGAGQVAAAVTFCAPSATLQSGDRLIVGYAWNAQSAGGLPSADQTGEITAAGPNCWLFEDNSIEGGGLAQTYLFTVTGGHGDWEFIQKFLKIYTGSASSASCTLTLTGAAGASNVMQYAFPKIEVIPAAVTALTDEEVANRARYEQLFSSGCATNVLCDPKTGTTIPY